MYLFWVSANLLIYQMAQIPCILYKVSDNSPDAFINRLKTEQIQLRKRQVFKLPLRRLNPI